MTPTTLQEQARLLLKLPRELRDMIYSDVVAEDGPIPLFPLNPHPITCPTLSSTTIATEAMESFYGHNTFFVSFHLTKYPLASQRWGPHFDHARPFIRSLIVGCDEPVHASWSTRTSNDMDDVQLKSSSDRGMWEELLSLPKLCKLEVRMQKYYDDTFSWMSFAPVLYHLRQNHIAGNFELTFMMSFDTILSKRFYDPYWSRFPHLQSNNSPDNSSNNAYDRMDYIDITNHFQEPSKEDRQYVKEHLSAKLMPRGRSVEQGLLNYSRADRRLLGSQYVVKEPALLRVQMWEYWEQWENWWKIEQDRRVAEEGKMKAWAV